MTNGIFTCPVCKQLLEVSGNSLKCKNNHLFDISKRGYVNLLMSQNNSNHGDDKRMVISRRDFLNLGHYRKLADAVADKVLLYSFKDCKILDIGCGEGYYTDIVLNSLISNNVQAEISGIDISKTALDYACRRNNRINYAVASAFSLPVPDNSQDIFMNIFAPHDMSEVTRVMKNNGKIIMVFPRKRHLWELKQLVYSNPYENESPVPDFEGFHLVSDDSLTYSFELKSNKELMNLFDMTPYAYKTSEEDIQKLKSTDKLTVTADFRIAVLERA